MRCASALAAWMPSLVVGLCSLASGSREVQHAPLVRLLDLAPGARMLLLRGGDIEASASELRMSAFDHLEAGDLSSAASFLMRSLQLERDDDMLEVLSGVASALSSAGEHDTALHSLRFALEFEPHDVSLQEALVIALRRANRLREAAESCYSMIENSVETSESCWLYHHLGGVLQELVPLPGTGLDWEQFDPDAPLPTIQLGQGSAELLSAEDCYRRAIQLHPSCGLVHKRLAELLSQTRGAEAAVEAWSKAACLLPEDICCATHHFYGAPAPRRRPPPALTHTFERDMPNYDGNTNADLVLEDRQTYLRSLHHAAMPVLSDLSVDPHSDDWEERAAAIFEEWGVVVLPRLLTEEECTVLKAAVEAADASDLTTDLTSDTRDPKARVHKALPLGRNALDEDGASIAEARSTVSRALATLYGILARVLSCDKGDRIPLLGAGWMRVSPGATDQPLHKDVRGFDRHMAVPPFVAECDDASRAVSIQLQLTDTAPSMSGLDGAGDGKAPTSRGSLVVLPGSHRPDAIAGHPNAVLDAIRDRERSGEVTIAVPPGSVTVYSSRAYHRGSANRSERARTFCFLTLCEPDSAAPDGLIHTMERDDVGVWWLGRKGLERRSDAARR